MHQISLTRACYMAGIDSSDDPLIRDMKLAAWMREAKAQLVDDSSTSIKHTDVEILIIKGNNHVSKS